MMSKIIDRVGKVYFDLTVVRFLKTGGQGVGAIWECRCVCGKLTECNSGELVSGHKKSCGCRRAKSASAQSYRHGLGRHELYNVWYGMIDRCTNELAVSYRRYGGRGISVCKRWMGLGGLKRFIEDMGPRPKDASLERKDNDKGYSPSNCIWATSKQQANNKGSNRRITYMGQTMSVAAWAARMGFPDRHLVWSRIKRGWSPKRALTTPSRRLKTV